MTIELSPEQKIKLLNSDHVYSVMQEILLREEQIDQEKEHFWMIGLANNNRILFIELVSLGSVNATTVEPMNVFRVAVLKGAVNAIMVHNHPSGELKPSEKDLEVTDRLFQVGRILSIRVLDHLVISDKSFLSFVDSGLMAKIEKSTKWVPQFELVERIQKEERKIREQVAKTAKLQGKKEGVKEGIEKGIQKGLEKGVIQGHKQGILEKAIAMAKAMKKDKEAIEKIIRYTGLTEAEIKKIK